MLYQNLRFEDRGTLLLYLQFERRKRKVLEQFFPVTGLFLSCHELLGYSLHQSRKAIQTEYSYRKAKAPRLQHKVRRGMQIRTPPLLRAVASLLYMSSKRAGTPKMTARRVAVYNQKLVPYKAIQQEN